MVVWGHLLIVIASEPFVDCVGDSHLLNMVVRKPFGGKGAVC